MFFGLAAIGVQAAPAAAESPGPVHAGPAEGSYTVYGTPFYGSPPTLNLTVALTSGRSTQTYTCSWIGPATELGCAESPIATGPPIQVIVSATNGDLPATFAVQIGQPNFTSVGVPTPDPSSDTVTGPSIDVGVWSLAGPGLGGLSGKTLTCGGPLVGQSYAWNHGFGDAGFWENDILSGACTLA